LPPLGGANLEILPLHGLGQQGAASALVGRAANLFSIVEHHDKVPASATSDPAAILTKALLMDSCVSLHATWSRRVALAAVWQSLYLFATFSAARKMISERIYCSRSFRRNLSVESACSSSASIQVHDLGFINHKNRVSLPFERGRRLAGTEWKDCRRDTCRILLDRLRFLRWRS
jgi:hypothetical protein